MRIAVNKWSINDRKNQGRKRTERGNSNEMRFLLKSERKPETGERKNPITTGMRPIGASFPDKQQLQTREREEIGNCKFSSTWFANYAQSTIQNICNVKRPIEEVKLEAPASYLKRARNDLRVRFNLITPFYDGLFYTAAVLKESKSFR